MTVAHICSDPKCCHYCLTGRAEAAEARATEAEHQRDNDRRAVEVLHAHVARLEAADNLAQKVEWAYNDACFTAPEDHERMNRQWRVMTDALTCYREASAVATESTETSEHDA